MLGFVTSGSLRSTGLQAYKVGPNYGCKVCRQSPSSPYRAPQPEELLDVEGISALALPVLFVCAKPSRREGFFIGFFCRIRPASG
jgi:hypothetical protein